MLLKFKQVLAVVHKAYIHQFFHKHTNTHALGAEMFLTLVPAGTGVASVFEVNNHRRNV